MHRTKEPPLCKPLQQALGLGSRIIQFCKI